MLDRVGRMQLPADFVRTLELRDRVRLDLAPDHVEVFRSDAPPKAPGEGPAAAQPPAGAGAGGEASGLPQEPAAASAIPAVDRPLLRRDLRPHDSAPTAPADEGDRE